MGRDTSESDSDLSSCQKTFDVEDNLEKKKQHSDGSKKHKCDFEGCGKSFHRPSKLEAHRRYHKGQRPFFCNIGDCNKAYTNSSHLKRHMKVSHEKSQLEILFRCPEEGCDAVLSTKQCLQKHIKRKHTELPYECPECKAKFKRNNQLKEHSFTHTGVPFYVCEVCKRGFERNYDLKRHMRGHRTYTCGLQNCSDTFTSMSLYRKHMATVHKPDYSCPICDKTFSSRSNLKTHFYAHKDLTEDWECPHEDCKTVFSQERYLNQHLLNVHLSLHEYKCPVEDCLKVFKWKRSLIRHVKLHSIKKSKVSRVAQKERKDKGQPKKSMAAMLAGVTLPARAHKELISEEHKTFVHSDDEVIIEDNSVSKEIDEHVLKSDIISHNCDKLDSLTIGKETFYRVENVDIEIISDCDISGNSWDCDERE